MQPAATRGIAPPRLPGGEEVEAEAEPGLQDDETLAPGPALRKPVSRQENVLRLGKAAGCAVIDVAECLGVGGALLESEAGGGERLGPALLCAQPGAPPPGRTPGNLPPRTAFRELCWP